MEALEALIMISQTEIKDMRIRGNEETNNLPINYPLFG